MIPNTRTASFLALFAALLAACSSAPKEVTDFELAASASELHVAQGASGELVLTLEGGNGPLVAPQLSVEGLPEGTHAHFSENPLVDSSVLQIEATQETQMGSYLLSVRGVAGPVVKEAAVELTIEFNEAHARAAQDIESTWFFWRPPRNAAPEAPRDFRFQEFQSESRIYVEWEHGERAEGYRIYRRIEPLLVAHGLAAGPDAQAADPAFFYRQPYPGSWHRIGSVSAVRNAFFDDDIPPADSRSLGSLYCYKVEAFNSAGTAQSDEMCTRNRGINFPWPVEVDSAARTATTLTVTWTDRSDIELGFNLYYRERAANAHAHERRIQIPTPNAETYTVRGLKPNTEYCFAVAAYDHLGESSRQSTNPGPYDAAACARTLAEPQQPEEHKSYSLNLNRQQVWQGNIPYAAQLGGSWAKGNVIKIENRSINPTLYFLKPLRSTEECNNPSAVVALGPGQTTTPQQLQEIFGTSSPELPLYIVACAAPHSPLRDSIQIKVTYSGNL